jgi:hypothetical protein
VGGVTLGLLDQHFLGACCREINTALRIQLLIFVWILHLDFDFLVLKTFSKMQPFQQDVCVLI